MDEKKFEELEKYCLTFGISYDDIQAGSLRTIVNGLRRAVESGRKPSNQAIATGLDSQRKADIELDEVHPKELRAFE